MYQKIQFIFTAFLVMSLFVLTGCDDSPSSPSSTTTEINPVATESIPAVNEEGNSAYPAPTLNVDNAQPGYPEPEAAQAALKNIPEQELPLQLSPSQSGATVGGIVVDARSQEAPPESIIYLGHMQYTEKGFPVVSLNRQEAPFVILPKNGGFVFENVEPGEYAIVFVTPDYSFLVEDEEGTSIIFTVEDGDVLDLGTMAITTSS